MAAAARCHHSSSAPCAHAVQVCLQDFCLATEHTSSCQKIQPSCFPQLDGSSTRTPKVLWLQIFFLFSSVSRHNPSPSTYFFLLLQALLRRSNAMVPFVCRTNSNRDNWNPPAPQAEEVCILLFSSCSAFLLRVMLPLTQPRSLCLCSPDQCALHMRGIQTQEPTRFHFPVMCRFK